MSKFQRALESANVPIQNAETTIAEEVASKGVVIDTEKVYSTAALDMEKFLREEVEVSFSEPGNEAEPAFVEVNVNGDYRLAMRDGNPVKLRRYHLAVVAQAKQSRVKQTRTVNPDGSMGFRETNVLSLTYPFQVLEDPNPKKGGPWLRQLLSNPA